MSEYENTHQHVQQNRCTVHDHGQGGSFMWMSHRSVDPKPAASHAS
jgi:hypothetical protein